MKPGRNLASELRRFRWAGSNEEARVDQRLALENGDLWTTLVIISGHVHLTIPQDNAELVLRAVGCEVGAVKLSL